MTNDIHNILYCGMADGIMTPLLLVPNVEKIFVISLFDRAFCSDKMTWECQKTDIKQYLIDGSDINSPKRRDYPSNQIRKIHYLLTPSEILEEYDDIDKQRWYLKFNYDNKPRELIYYHHRDCLTEWPQDIQSINHFMYIGALCINEFGDQNYEIFRKMLLDRCCNKFKMYGAWYYENKYGFELILIKNGKIKSEAKIGIKEIENNINAINKILYEDELYSYETDSYETETYETSSDSYENGSKGELDNETERDSETEIDSDEINIEDEPDSDEINSEDEPDSDETDSKGELDSETEIDINKTNSEKELDNDETNSDSNSKFMKNILQINFIKLLGKIFTNEPLINKNILIQITFFATPQLPMELAKEIKNFKLPPRTLNGYVLYQKNYPCRILTVFKRNYNGINRCLRKDNIIWIYQYDNFVGAFNPKCLNCYDMIHCSCTKYNIIKSHT
jgi:hypothetical protein